MRIAFVGKGGSGKTTTASLFARHMAGTSARVLAMDADINQHLAGSLGFDGELHSMGTDIDGIKRHLRGTNQLFDVSMMHKTTPPGRGSMFVTLDDDDWFMQTYAATAGDVHIVGAGDIPAGNVGVRCYHGLNGAIELVVGHLLDHNDDCVIIDMTAGADAFSSSLFAKVDALVLVVEPTTKSLSVYQQFLPHVHQYDIPLLVVGNKIQDSDDKAFIEQTVGPLTAWFGSSLFVRQYERGVYRPFDELEDDFKTQLAVLEKTIRAIPRDWDVLESRSHQLHRKNADDWMGKSAYSHIDPYFSLKKHAEMYLN